MKGKPLQVLLVEDSAGDARLLREMFRTETPGSFVLTTVERMSDALSHLAKAPGVDIKRLREQWERRGQIQEAGL
jgi:CheY-like chemotaxis protein